jgi:hypothetical protein
MSAADHRPEELSSFHWPPPPPSLDPSDHGLMVDSSKAATLFGETLIRISQVPKLFPLKDKGGRVGVSSVYRWVQRGVRGIRLETIRAPWGQMTSVEAVERFIVRLNPGAPDSSRLRSTTRRQEIAKANRVVAKALGLPLEVPR